MERGRVTVPFVVEQFVFIYSTFIPAQRRLMASWRLIFWSFENMQVFPPSLGQTFKSAKTCSLLVMVSTTTVPGLGKQWTAHMRVSLETFVHQDLISEFFARSRHKNPPRDFGSKECHGRDHRR
jgi:hypothetical protein